jgi:release factor glutamine methyltransferase
VTAIDVSADALALAAENVERTGLAGGVTLVEHDLRTGLPGGPYDLVVSNPPYVLPEEIETLEPEVSEWEPRTALVGRGATEAIVEAAPRVLGAAGWLVLEVGDGTAEAVAQLLVDAGFRDVVRTPDLTGRDRVVEGRWES